MALWKLDNNKIYTKIIDCLSDNSTIYDVLKFASQFNNYLVDCIIANNSTITQEEIEKLILELKDFLNDPYNIIIKNITMLEEKNIKVELEDREEINVYADDFYIEQVITNYITNAIKNVKPTTDGQRIIKIENEFNKNNSKVRVKVFNSGENIKEEDLNRIWNRFYKVDESRNRENGGTGIGLSFVKAIMNNYKNDYGVINKEDGVEFYFELDLRQRGQS